MGPELMEQTRAFRGERIVMALSWSYACRALPPGQWWPDYGIRRAIAGCKIIGRWLEWGMGLDEVTVREGWIDPDTCHCVP